MSHELMYTSVPKGLRTGSMGYCTVAVTQNCPALLQEKLENLSGYRHLYSPFDANARLNPVCLQHVRMSIGGKTYSILSSITDAGIDYSKRANKFAHHVALEAANCPSGNPAWALSQPQFLQNKWVGDPHSIPVGRMPAAGGTNPGVAQSWKQLTGDAGWAGVLAEAFLKEANTPYYVIFDPGTSVLPLFVEAIALLPREKQWQVTFSTYYQAMSADVQCAWRAVARNSPEAQQALARKLPLIDLAHPGTAPDSQMAHLARTGERLPLAKSSIAQPKTSPPFADPSDGHYEIKMEEMAQQEPVLLHGKKQKAGKNVSLKTFEEKNIVTQKMDESEQPKSKVPFIIATSICALLLLFGILVTVILTLPGSTKDEARATQPALVNNAAVNNEQDKAAHIQGVKDKDENQRAKQAEMNKAVGKQARDGSLDDLDKKDQEKSGKKQEEQEPKNDGSKKIDKEPVPASKKEGNQFGTSPDKLAAPPLMIDKTGNQPVQKSGFKTVEEGNTPPAGNLTRPVDPVLQPEYIPVIYHKIPAGQFGAANAPITLAKLESNNSSISFLHDGVLKGHVFVPTRNENGYIFETVENPKRAIRGPIIIGELRTSLDALVLTIKDPTNLTEVFRYLKANPIVSKSHTNESLLHVFIEGDPAQFASGNMPVVHHVDRSKWPKLSESRIEPDHDVRQKLDRININWYKQMKSNWAEEINSKLLPKVVLGNTDTVKFFVTGEQHCPEDKLRRKLKNLRLDLNELKPISLETFANYSLSYVGKVPPSISDNDKQATIERKQSELATLKKEADELSPIRIEFHDIKYVITMNGKSFLMWQTKPLPVAGPSAPHGLNAGGVSK